VRSIWNVHGHSWPPFTDSTVQTSPPPDPANPPVTPRRILPRPPPPPPHSHPHTPIRPPRPSLPTGHDAIESPSGSRFSPLAESGSDTAETLSTFRIRRSVPTTTPAMRRSIDVMLMKEFARVPPEQRRAVQQALESDSDASFSPSGSPSSACRSDESNDDSMRASVFPWPLKRAAPAVSHHCCSSSATNHR